MKRILTIISLVLTLTTTAQAQEVFTEIRSKALATVRTPGVNDMIKQINQFKVDALDYMVIKMKEQMPDSTATFLDKQALAMNNFVGFYMRTILENNNQPKAFQVKIIKLFMDASYSNPLFNDQDKELALAYFSDGNSLTRFSLDTDWRRAYIAVSTEMKKMK